KKTRAGIKNEWQNGLKNDRGTISMARVGGNPDSGTSQFFISVVDNPRLDARQPDGAAYAVFGKVIKGMEVVDKIKGVQTANVKGNADVPTETITLTKASRIDPASPEIKTEIAKAKMEREQASKKATDDVKNAGENTMK